jgi:hypothetical protein
MSFKKASFIGVLLSFSSIGFAYERKVCGLFCPWGYDPSKECACLDPVKLDLNEQDSFDESNRSCHPPIRR